MDRLITLLCALIVAAGAMWGWDRRPPVDVRLSVPIIHPHIQLPGGIVSQQQSIIAAQRAELMATRANNATLAAALRDQRQSFEDRAADDVKRLTEASQALTKAKAATRDAEAIAAQLIRPLKGIDQCARADEAFARLKASLTANANGAP